MSTIPSVITIQSMPTLFATSNPFDFVSQVFCGRYVRDRFNVLNQYSKINWVDTVDPIPTPSDTSLEDLMDERAVELIKQGSIAVQWSGGVDSTALLLALIKNGISKEDLVICHDNNSVVEYPKLFVWLQDNNWNLKQCKDWYAELSTIDTNLITNGWCADQLFGSVFFHTASQYYSYSITDFIDKANLRFGNPEKSQIPEFTEIYQKYGKDLFNLDLSTAAELGWFINFVMKWTWVSKYNDLWLLQTKNKNKTKVFYDTQGFQNWSLGNFEHIKEHNIYGEDARFYKKPLKDYCNSVFPDERFLLEKGKQPSWNASNNKSMYTKQRVIIETTSGYHIHNINKVPSYEKWENAFNQIFTSIQK